MATVKPIKVPDFEGGMNTSDATILEDNQVVLAQNMFYDKDKTLTSRRGSQAFGTPVSDVVVLIHACDSTASFAVADDATNLTTGTAKRGTNSVSFDIDVSTTGDNFATLSNASVGNRDITLATHAVGFWLFVPTGVNTDLTDIKFRLGSDSSNYYEWTLPTLTENSNNFIVLLFADAVETGTVNDALINYLRLQVTYSGSYTDKLGVRLDSIYAYSSTSTKANHSIQFHEASDGTRYLFCGTGTAIFLYDELSEFWEVINTGLSDGDPFESAMFKDVVYITKKLDDYRSFDGTAFSTHGTVPRGAAIRVANDVGYLAITPSDPSTIFYTNSNPSNLTSFPNNETVDEDNGQIITGLTNLGPLVIALKERSSYIFNVATPSIEQVDYDGGCKSNRSIARVENDLFFLSDIGVTSLSQRQGTVGSLRGEAISDNIRREFGQITNQNISCSIYWPATNNFYIAVDDEGTGENRAIYVRSTLTKAWTVYKGINARQFVIWRDSDDVEHLLAANPYGGQVIELETGFSDQGTPIIIDIITKGYDFGNAGLLKTHQRIDFGGFHSQLSSVPVTVTVRNITNMVKTKTIAYDQTADGAGSEELNTLGSKTLGSTPFGGSTPGGANLDLFDFIRHMPLMLTGRRVQMRFTASLMDAAFALTKINIHPIAQPVDFVPTSLYI